MADRERQYDAAVNMKLRVELRDAELAEELQMERALAMSRVYGLGVGLQARRARMRACSHSYTPPQ